MARPAQLALAIGFAVGAAAGRAEATPATTQADALFQQGRRAAEKGDAAGACKLFTASYRLEPAVGTLLNLGDCSERQGDVQAAYDYFDAARSRMAANDDRLPILLQRIDKIEAVSGKLALHLASTAPPGTTVSLDGAPYDTSRTAPMFVTAAKHIVLVTAVGHRGTRYELTFDSGQVRTFDVTPGDELETVLPTAPPEETHQTGRAVLRVSAVSAFGLSVAALWIGTAAGIVAMERKNVQDANCDANNLCNRVGYDAAQSGSSWATASTAFFLSGIGLAAVGVGLFVWSTRIGKVSATASLGPGSIALQGSF